jgi:hypothetical protein
MLERMTDTIALNLLSAIRIIKDGVYEVYMDGPIWVNHYVHAFRVAVIVER